MLVDTNLVAIVLWPIFYLLTMLYVRHECFSESLADHLYEKRFPVERKREQERMTRTYVSSWVVVTIAYLGIGYGLFF